MIEEFDLAEDGSFGKVRASTSEENGATKISFSFGPRYFRWIAPMVSSRSAMIDLPRLDVRNLGLEHSEGVSPAPCGSTTISRLHK
jgi:hypothetical protein